ncbi:hypothetical protein C7H85_12090 [Zobellella endophytica]|uniref:Uncharacterized protein n=1 Tax=Zobellella endophytica TaxID=2116700 RepID=A0A2P7R3E9_9GAMM|nr:multiheme c-type cytochrome [Zobellella endophytica]PSJ44715.1 hypothetical protein C7H85_12090 [Zobellella endophytica]
MLIIFRLLACLPFLWGMAAMGNEALDSQGKAELRYVGSQLCASCHQAEFSAWRSSHHALAMQHADEDSVLGDFNDATFTYAGVTSRFSRRDGRYFVETDGPNGKLQEFEIEYTFGYEPLQQYLVSIGGGRLQALSIAWDSRPGSEGGQHWFHLHPEDAVTHEDDLHWTRPAQNWNHMCADCHSTNLRKGYDSDNDSFNTTWSEMSVGCEACHGPGSGHVDWAKKPGTDKNLGLSIRLRQHGLGQEEEVLTSANGEVATCARCHSFRSQLAEGYYPGQDWLDYYRPEPLIEPFYHIDGQQREEVFTWGSFAQSRMHAEGVSCSSCHDPHTQQLKAQGNDLCVRCHTATEYDTPEHHFHPVNTAGAQCVNCHMPATTYMVNDPRRDHSLRIPRPDRTLNHGTPNACNNCHDDRSAEWAQQHIEQRFPARTPGYQEFAQAFSMVGSRHLEAGKELAKLLTGQDQPEIVRASAAAYMNELEVPFEHTPLQAGLADASPLVRHAALVTLADKPGALGEAQLLALLTDKSRLVRSEAARLLVGNEIPEAVRSVFEDALKEYEQELQLHADRADGRNRLALLRWQQGLREEALAQLRKAVQLDDRHVASYVNLSDMLRAVGRETEALRWLQQGLAIRPDAAALHYAMGLAKVRQKQQEQAREHLEKAHLLAPGEPRFAYAYAVSLAPTAPGEALAVLSKALELSPRHQELLWAMATYSLQYQGPEQAMPYARRLQEIDPEAARVQRLLKVIEHAGRSSDAPAP